jgi:hypothetical protein
MTFIDWESRLANELNHVQSRTQTATESGKRKEDIRRQLTVSFLEEMSQKIKQSLEKFNQSSRIKMEFIDFNKDNYGNRYFGIKLLLRKLHFVDTERGFVRVDLLEGSAVREAAFILARLSRSGDLITWEEKNLLGFGNQLEPVTLDHLVRKYMTYLVNKQAQTSTMK